MHLLWLPCHRSAVPAGPSMLQKTQKEIEPSNIPREYNDLLFLAQTMHNLFLHTVLMTVQLIYCLGICYLCFPPPWYPPGHCVGPGVPNLPLRSGRSSVRLKGPRLVFPLVTILGPMAKESMQTRTWNPPYAVRLLASCPPGPPICCG